MSRGLVGVLAQDTARFSVFAASLTGLETPAETQIKWVIGHPIASSTNELCEIAIAADADWLFILGDDHAFAPNLLTRLLAHAKNIVVPLCLTRQPPYKPVIFADWDDEQAGVRRRVNLADHPGGGLIPIHSAGSAGMLIRRPVLDRMERPWFEAGRASSVEIGEDFYFCDKARDLGFALYADLDTPLGHCTTATVWPVRQEFGWTYGFVFTGGLKLTMPTDAWDAAELAAQ